MLTVYGFSRIHAMAYGRTRDLRVLWALEEMGLPFVLMGLDYANGELDAPAMRALNPFRQLPVIDDDGVVVSESGAILLYLARKSGRLWAADEAGRTQVSRWCFAALTTVEPPLLGLDLLEMSQAQALGDEYKAMAARALSSLEDWLQGREFVATDAFTVADILMALVLSDLRDDAVFAPFPAVRAYRERCLARPAWKTVCEAYRAWVKPD